VNAINAIAAELHQLHLARQEHLHGQHRHEPGAALHWAQLVHRYDTLLDQAADMLDIPHPPGRPRVRCYRPEQRAELEQGLAAAGLDVHPRHHSPTR
jgi:hypothetical protein